MYKNIPIYKGLIGFFITIFILAASAFAQDYDAQAKVTIPFGKADKTLIVSRAIDGDTLKLSDGERVRLIGIDTPESSNNAKLRRDAKRTGQDAKAIIAMGKEAKEFTRKLVENKKVKLEFDVQKRDKYSRLLAYVYLEDGTFVNAEIMKAGYAQVMTVPPNVHYQDLFLRLQREARENKKGLWK